MATKNETTIKKDESLRSLEVRRYILILASIASAIGTFLCIIFAAFLWAGRSERYSGDWWGGITYGGLAFVVLMLYLFAIVFTFDHAGITIPLPRWCGYLILPLFWVGCLVFCTTCVVSHSIEATHPPLFLSLTAEGLCSKVF